MAMKMIGSICFYLGLITILWIGLGVGLAILSVLIEWAMLAIKQVSKRSPGIAPVQMPSKIS